MTDSSTVVEFVDVALEGSPGYDGAIDGVSFSLRPAELMVVLAPPPRRLPLADAAQGLTEATQGNVHFLGYPWSARSPDQAAADRVRIGRTFYGAGWISNLDVDENMTLKLRHHTSRPWKDIEAEALALAGRFGLSEIPRKRPAWVAPEDLARAQWVRALLGAPGLLLLEYPEPFADPAQVAALKAAVRQRVDDGAAAIWMTADEALCDDAVLNADVHYRIHEHHWSGPLGRPT